jgi:hypothetical protein
MCVVFMINYFFSGRRCPVDSETFSVTDFVNLKIKPTQYFECSHRGKMCVRVFIRVGARTYINICVYTVFLKKMDRLFQSGLYVRTDSLHQRLELVPWTRRTLKLWQSSVRWTVSEHIASRVKMIIRSAWKFKLCSFLCERETVSVPF